MIIYGWKQYVRVLAVLTLVCGQCAIPAEHVIRRLTTKFTLFWIPLFPIGRKHTMICTGCEAETKISREQAEQLAMSGGQPAPHAGPPPMQQHLPPQPLPQRPVPQPQPAFGPPPQYQAGPPPMRPQHTGPQQPYGAPPQFGGQPGYPGPRPGYPQPGYQGGPPPMPAPHPGQPQPAAYPPAGYPPPNNGYPYGR